MAGRLYAHREAQKRYRQTAEGQRAHREAERRRRMRRAKKNVDDRGSTPISIGCTIPSSYSKSTGGEREGYKNAGVGRIGRCQFCGSYGTIVNKFPRRGYGRKNVRAPMTQRGKEHGQQKRFWAEKRYPHLRRKGEKMKSFWISARGLLFKVDE